MSRISEELDPSTFGADLAGLTRRTTQSLSAQRTAREERAAKEAQYQRETLYRQYWQKCLELIDLIGNYNQKKKNCLNVIDPQTAHTIKTKVVSPYYHGETSSLYRHRDNLRCIIWQKIDALNLWVVDAGLDVELIDGDVLLGLTIEGNNRQKFRHHIEKNFNAMNPPYALTELPSREFRQPAKPAR